MRTRTFLLSIIVYAALCVALGALLHRYFYLGLVGIAVARPLLREVGLLADRDERQRVISYSSSHLAFLVVMLIAGLEFVKTAIIDAGEPPLVVSVILFVGLMVKFAGLVMRARARRLAGVAIAWVIGGGWLLFTLASHGLSLVSLVEATPWLAVFVFALVGRKWPKVGGTGLLIVGLATLYFFVVRFHQPIGPRLLVAALVPSPLLLAGALLIAGDRDWKEEP